MGKSNMKTALALGAMYAAITVVLILLIPVQKKHERYEKFGRLAAVAETDARAAFIIENEELYPEELLKIFYANENNLNFVYNYAFHKDDYRNMEYTAEELAAEVPALYMFDHRWGYETIGGNYIKADGCAAVSLAMAAVALGRTDIDPVKVARTAEENGFVAFFGGIPTSKIPELAEILGLNCVWHNYDTFTGSEEHIDEQTLRAVLDRENCVVIAAMNGDTFGTHAIVLRGYDDKGYYVNDPANEEKTAKTWDYSVFDEELVGLYEIS